MEKIKRKRNWRKYSAADWIFNICNVLILLVVCVVSLYPFYQMFMISLNDPIDAARGGIYFFPRKFSLESYVAVFQNEMLATAFAVTIARTVIGTVTSLLATSLLAYGLSKPKLMFNKFYMIFALITMFFSGGTIPYFIVMEGLGFVDNFLVFILPMLISVWNMIILKAFFQNIPGSLEESAQLDGCGWYRMFFSIVVPLSVPALATVGLFNAVTQWNSWFDANIFIFDKTYLYPLQTILMQIINQNEAKVQMDQIMGSAGGAIKVTSESLKIATMMVATLPIVLVYPFIQRFFVKGIMLGSVKE